VTVEGAGFCSCSGWVPKRTAACGALNPHAPEDEKRARRSLTGTSSRRLRRTADVTSERFVHLHVRPGK
jgi:hypothetical protein